MSGSGDGGNSFEDRLQAARRRQGLDAPPPDTSGGAGKDTPSALGVGLRVGVELVSALVVAVAIGWWLDKWLHTSPVLLAVFVLLGGAAGVANVWRLMGPGRAGSGSLGSGGTGPGGIGSGHGTPGDRSGTEGASWRWPRK